MKQPIQLLPYFELLKFIVIFSSNFKIHISQLGQLKIVDKSLRKKLILKANKQISDNIKTPTLEINDTNHSVERNLKVPAIGSQYAIYDYLVHKN